MLDSLPSEIFNFHSLDVPSYSYPVSENSELQRWYDLRSTYSEEIGVAIGEFDKESGRWQRDSRYATSTGSGWTINKILPQYKQCSCPDGFSPVGINVGKTICLQD